MPPKTFLQWLDEKEKPIQKALHTPVRKTLNRRVSAGIATVGGGLISTKVPFVTQLGYGMQVPALLWDVYDFAKNPTIANGAEFIPDIMNKVGQIRGKNWDDAMRYAGMSNDAAEAVTGRSGVEWVDYLANKKSKRKQISEQLPINLVNKNASKEGKDR